MGHENGGWMNSDQRDAMKSAANERVQNQVTAVPWEGPKTLDEARCFHEGFLAGATAYAKELCVASKKEDNPLLASLFDEQGWKTIEMYESLIGKCEHGVPEGDWCQPCNAEYKRAAQENGT